MRGQISGVSGLSGILLVGLLVVAGGCRTLRTPDGRWQSLDDPAEECLLRLNQGGAPDVAAPDAVVAQPGIAPDGTEPLSIYADTDELAARLRGAGLFGIDCTGNPFSGLADAWRTGAGHSVAFRGDRVQHMLADEAGLSGVDSIRWESPALTLFSRNLADDGLLGVYGALVQPSPDVVMRTTVDDERDLVDDDIDVLVTPRDAVRNYAERAGRHGVVELPLTRLYVVVAPTGLSLSDGLATTLAQGIAADTRVFDPRNGEACSPADSNTSGGTGAVGDGDGAGAGGAAVRARVLYDESDASARDLASRVVALASQGRLAPDRYDQLAMAGTGQLNMVDETAKAGQDYAVLRLRVKAPVVGSGRTCVPLSGSVVKQLVGRAILPVAWVHEYGIARRDVMLYEDVHGLPVIRRAGRVMQ